LGVAFQDATGDFKEPFPISGKYLPAQIVVRDPAGLAESLPGGQRLCELLLLLDFKKRFDYKQAAIKSPEIFINRGERRGRGGIIFMFIKI